jgi:hypothetical protein
MKGLLFRSPSSRGRQANQGSALLVTLVFAVVCGITLGSYFTLASQEHLMVVRSQNWNAALAMAEAGIDEALAQMNATNVVAGDFSQNGWGGAGTNYGPVTRTLAGGYYCVGISGGAVPAIYSTGFVSVAGSRQKVSRHVKVTTTTSQVSPFSVGLGAVGNINMNGHHLITDSYNSQTNSLSSNGQYDATKTSTNGNVASVGGIVNLGQESIDGNLYLGPDATYDGSGTVMGKIYYDYNIQFPVVMIPTADTNGNSISWMTPTEYSTGGGHPTYYYDFQPIDSGGYFLINNSDSITVEPGVSVTLHVTATSFAPATISLNGGTTNSGTIVMYQDSGSVTLGGNADGGAIANRPVNFIYLGLPGVTSITFSGTSDFVGAVYAPEAVLSLNGGGGSQNLDGAAIVGQATDNGHYHIHYDESLANWASGPNRGYIPVSWQEF